MKRVISLSKNLNLIKVLLHPRKKSFLRLSSCLSLMALVVLPSCLYEETAITPNRIRVQEEKFFEEVPLAQIDADYVASRAQHYSKYGGGPIDLTLTFDPLSKSNTSANAKRQQHKIIKAFEKKGVSDITTNLMPVHGSAEDSFAILSYQTYTALAPKGCDREIPGYEEYESIGGLGAYEYKLGCTYESLIAKQVARPKDLLGGQPAPSSSDGRRASNIVELHRTATPNEPLEGDTASEN